MNCNTSAIVPNGIEKERINLGNLSSRLLSLFVFILCSVSAYFNYMMEQYMISGALLTLALLNLVFLITGLISDYDKMP